MEISSSHQATPSPLLEAHELVKRYRVRQTWLRRVIITAVDGISFTGEKGHTVALVGESGCGKTTVGKLILGLLEPDGGMVYFKGQKFFGGDAAMRRMFRRAVQMVFQNPVSPFNPMLTIGASMMDAMRLRNDLSTSDKRDEAIRLLKRVGLEPEFMARYPTEMSGGQMQRVGVARALASNPQVIFLDEPTSALDMSVRGQILNLLLDLQAEYGLTYVLVSHDLRVVSAVAHYMLVMYLGQVMEEGPVEEIILSPMHPYTQGLLSATLVGHSGQERTKKPVRVTGEVLQLPQDYHGCKLHRRCPFELERCSQEPQVLAELTPRHFVRCWRAKELANLQ